MNKLFLALCLTLFAGIFTFAQSSDDYHKGEFSAEFSHNQVETGVRDNNSSNTTNNFRTFFDKRQGFNGFELSGVGNVSRYVGLKGDFSANYKNYNFGAPNIVSNTTDRFGVDASVYNLLGGVQIKDNAKDGARFRPFGHALVGVARGRTKLDNSFYSSAFCQRTGVDCRNNSNSDTGFAAAFGGGIDIKATDRFSVRAIQVDYNPTHLNGFTQDNIRFGVGVVVH